MKIGINQLDGKIPNIALMKIATYHRAQGDEVEWWNGPLFPYDKVYASKIFKFTEEILPAYVIRGGTGFSGDTKLPAMMDSLNHRGGWFLYPKYTNHLGFSERGCRLNCSFCVVPEKEGKPREDLSISDLLSNPKGEDRLTLLDDDFLGHPNFNDVAMEILDRRLKVNFSQGLNIRIITDRQAELISKMKFNNFNFKKKQLTFAWDNFKDKEIIKKGFNRCLDAGIKAYQMQFFVLIGYESEPEQDLERVETIRSWGADPFVMAYDRNKLYQRRFQRWVNRRELFKSTSFAKYTN